MALDLLIAGLVALALILYLGYTLVYPERF